MVCFHIGVNFFGGGGTTDVSDVEFEVVAEVVVVVVVLLDIDDDVVVEVVDLGIMLTVAGKPEGLLFQRKLEVGGFPFVGLLDSEDGWD